MSGVRRFYEGILRWVVSLVAWTILLLGPGMNLLGLYLAYQGSALAAICIAVGTILCLGFQWTIDKLDPPPAMSKVRTRDDGDSNGA